MKVVKMKMMLRRYQIMASPMVRRVKPRVRLAAKPKMMLVRTKQ